MNLRPLPLALFALGLASCSAPGGAASAPAASPQRAYSGTASVGDFLTINVDSSLHTISYTNASNGDTGNATYTVNADGTYAINDPSGNFISAYEVPNYAMVINAQKTGPAHNTPSLVTAVESGHISMATWSGHKYNYMQFRTNSGGLEVGSISVAADGTVSGQSYSPYGTMNGDGPFHQLNNGVGIPGNLIQADPSGTFLTVTQGGDSDHLFGTANGQFMVDTTNGAILGFQQASNGAFDSSFAGTYTAMYYTKHDAQTGPGNVETGTGGLDTAIVVITADGHITVTNSEGIVVVPATTVLSPVGNTSYLVGAGELTDPCPGLYTFRVSQPGSQQDVFVTFQGRAILFSSFTETLPISQGNTYSYAYGVALH